MRQALGKEQDTCALPLQQLLLRNQPFNHSH